MFASAVRRPHRAVWVLALYLLRAAIAGGFAPNTDTSVTAGTFFTQSDSTGLLRTLTTSTEDLTPVRTEFSSTGTLSDIRPGFTETEVRAATDQRQSAFSTETESWTSHNIPDEATELLSSSASVGTTTTVTEWGDPSTVANITVAYLDLSKEQHTAANARTVRDLTVTKLTEQDITDMDTTESFSRTDSTYISSTISRAGERTLLSITSNSTSPYTEDSSSDSGPNTFTSQMGGTGVTQGRDITDGALSTEADRTRATLENQQSTNATQEGATESQKPSVSQSTQSQTGESNITETGFEVTPDIINHNATPSFTVVSSSEGETDNTATAGSSTSRSSYTDTSMFASSVAPLFVSSEDSSTNISYHDSQSLTTETPTSSMNTVLDTKPHEPQTPMDETTIPSLTTTLLPVTPTVDDSLNKFLSGKQPFIPETHYSPAPTEVLNTVTGSATQKPQYTEEGTYMTITEATETLASTSTSISTSTAALLTTHQLRPSTTTKMPIPHTTLSTIKTTEVPTTPTSEQNPPYSRTATVPQSPSSSKPGDIATDVSTLHLETSTATPGNTTAHGRHTTASYSKSTPNRSTVEMTTGKHTERVPTQTETTTTQMLVKSTLTPGHMCRPQTCANGGRCVPTADHGYRCECLPAWTGASCTEDVDKCVSSPCPQDSVCMNTRGSFSCECALGYDLEDGRSCTQAKTFLGTFSVNGSVVHMRSIDLHELHKEILQLLNASLSILHGYRRSTVRDRERSHVSAVNMFSMFSNVTSSEVYNSIQMSLRNSNNRTQSILKLRYQLAYHVESLCLAQNNRCDTQSSVCNDARGTPYCQCHEGFFKKNSEDTTCRDCGDGFELVNGTCVECMFGFGGFNCKNFYGLIAKVVSPAAGGLLLIVIIALIVTCCRKDKNDINKIIFKSGDLQMSPYAEFPKSSRVSMEWGRETIEMQENGSTKNLLQMTDIYYSPALRNADLERNGLYPFSGLPGSRHSCIYPAQWNPSFISDDSRRRDYF